MDALLSRITQQAMNYAIRSGIAVTSGIAISQCSRLMKNKDGKDKEELESLQRRLDGKIRIISPAIDMIELITARGNTSLESAVSLTKSLRYDIQALGSRLANAAAEEENSRKGSSKAKSQAERDQDLAFVKADMRKLLEKIEDAVPLINLAITTSGVSLTTNLPASISPSRLLQASTFLSAGDARYAANPSTAAQIGPTFTLSMYMLFSGHAFRPRPKGEEELRQNTWKEVIHKARLKLVRTSIERLHRSALVPFGTQKTSRGGSDLGSGRRSPKIPATAMVDEFAYQLTIVEDLDDGRVHDDELQSEPFDGVQTAGIREIVPIHEVSKIFYADTGKILNIGNNEETNNPVLLLKRDVNASPPQHMVDGVQNVHVWDDEADGSELEDRGESGVDGSCELAAQFERETSVLSTDSSAKNRRLPPDLDPEWIAFEVYVEEPDSDTESDIVAENHSSPASRQSKRSSGQTSLDPSIGTALSDLRLEAFGSEPSSITRALPSEFEERQLDSSTTHSLGLHMTALVVRTSLSLLEMLIRLTSLQQFQQASHLTITDELLNFFLEESSTTGAAPGDVETRKRIRMTARQRVGFDPYDESPIKRRGEQYQYHESPKNLETDRKAWSSPLRSSTTKFSP